MLYVIQFANGWFKLGHTSSDVWTRACQFWTNTHPTDLCGKLGPDDVQVLALFVGGREQEQSLFKRFPPKCGEFYHEGDLRPDELIAAIELDRLPVPAKPVGLVSSEEKLKCCGGAEYSCFTCGANFSRGIKLKQHLDDVHRKVKSKCARCQKMVIPRNLKRHLQACKA